MNILTKLFCVLSIYLLTGCAQLEFFDTERKKEGLTYYVPKPYLYVTNSVNCITTATVVMLPGNKRTVAFRSGYGSANLTVKLSNGMITSVNQQTDTKIPETITAISKLAPLMAAAPGTPIPYCKPKATLFEINDDGTKSTTAIDLPAPSVEWKNP